MSGFDFEGEELSSSQKYWIGYYAKHPEPSNAFVRAAATGDIDAVRRMLGEGAKIDQRDEGFKDQYGSMRDMREPNTLGATALEMAARTKNLEMLKFLFEAGADPFPTNPYRPEKKDSIVDAVLFSGFAEGLRYLVDEQGLQLCDDKEEAWILVHAINEKSSVDMLRYLVEEKGLNLDRKTPNGISPASAANSRGISADFLEYIYQKNAVPSGTQDVWPLLNVSFAEGAKKDLEEITGEDFNSLKGAMKFMTRFTSHSTLLNEAVFNGDVEKVGIHLKYGADPQEKDSAGVDAIGVLQLLKKADHAIFGYQDAHAEIEKMIDVAMRSRPKPATGTPKP